MGTKTSDSTKNQAAPTSLSKNHPKAMKRMAEAASHIGHNRCFMSASVLR